MMKSLYALLMLYGASINASALIEPLELGAPRQGDTYVLENDLFGGRNQDRWYTNGIHYSSAVSRGREPTWLHPLVGGINDLRKPEGCTAASAEDRCGLTMSFGLGQNMYTPRVIDTAAPQLRDRPWAGWLYGAVGLSRYDGNRHEMISLKAGPIGPASLAEQAQKIIHRRISRSPEPLGWGNQVRPRLGVQVGMLETYRYVLARTFGLHVSLGGVLGNTRTLARAGLGLTWSPVVDEVRRHQPGTLDEGDFLVPDFNSRVKSDTWADALKHTVFYLHGQSAFVGYNGFLQGVTFAGSPQITPIRHVATMTIGLSVPIGSNGRYKLGFAAKRRSPEFSVRGEVARDSYQRWGAFSLSVDLDP